MRGIHSISLFKNKMDINIIMEMKDFSNIVNDLKIEQSFIDYLYV
ncbi:hypothetical protein [Jeotgalibaca sp. MA1X17-3]|nr:hypothetical protein [Jeotgalibaca sp. MA1X17-3]